MSVRLAVYGVTLAGAFLAGFFEMRIWGEMEASLDWNTQGLDVVPRALRNVAKEYERRNPEDKSTMRRYKNLARTRISLLILFVIEIVALQR